MKLAYVVPANRIIKDQETQKYSLIDVFDLLTIPKDTPLISSFGLAGRINEADLGTLNVVVRVLDPDGNAFATATLTGPVVSTIPDATKIDVQISVYFNALKFEKPGKYKFVVDANGVTLESGELYLLVRKAS